MREYEERGVYAEDGIFFGEGADLECDLHEGAGDAADEDDVAERIEEERFEVSFSGACEAREKKNWGVSGKGGRTAYAGGWSDVDFYGGFGGQFIAALHFDGPVHSPDYRVAVLCVCC